MDPGDLLMHKPLNVACTRVVCLLLLAIPVHGRVFYRTHAADLGNAVFEQLGGQVAYRADVRINDGKGTLDVFHFGDHIDRVVSNLHGLLGHIGLKQQSGDLRITTTQGRDRVLRLVVIRIPDSGQTLLFKIEQTTDQYARSAPPQDHRIHDVPAFPDATPLFFAEDLNSNMRFALASAHTGNEAVLGYYRASMKAAGWKSALPAPLHENAGMLFYLKGRDLCCIAVTPSEEHRMISHIAVLHKQPGLDH